MNAFNRLRPTRGTLIALIGFLWAVSFGAVRDFVWADLREGLIDLRGLSRPVRAIAWIGFGLLALMLIAVLFNDFWRATSPLLTLTEPLPGRGRMLPTALLPATLFLLAVSWAFLLAGALRSHILIRLGVLFLFLPAAGLWLANSLASAGLSGVGIELVVSGAGTLAVPLFFALAARRKPRPAGEFLALLVLTALVFVPTQAADVESWRQLGSPLMVAKIEAMLGFLGYLILPLLLLVGVDIANFARQASSWTMRVATERFPFWLEVAALIALLGLRLRFVALEASARIAADGFSATALAYAGSLGVIIIVGLAWLLVTRVPAVKSSEVSASSAAEAGERLALPLIIASNGAQLIAFAGLWISLGLLPLLTVVGSLSGAADRFGKAAATPWTFAIDILAVVAAVYLARRGQRGPALYLAIFGLLALWFELTAPGRPLAVLTWEGAQPTDFWLVVTLVGMALVWTAQRRLTEQRVAALLFAGILTGLLRQTDFISSPFSPLFGFAGVGFLVFGLAWDALTAGSWANAETRGLPRTGRIFLYLGYVLLTVTAVNWAVTGHDLAAVGRLTGDVAIAGLNRFGRPMLYAVLAAALLNPGSLEEDRE
jgi:hypothetical protein